MMQPEAFADLEYGALREQLTQRCQSDLGRRLTSELQPLAERPAIEASLELNSELQACVRRGIGFDLESLCAIEPLFTEPEFSLFGFEEFKLIHQNALIATAVCAFQPDAEEFPRLRRLLGRLKAFPEICQRFGQIFDPEGEVLDTASPELARLRKRSNSLRGNILKTMQAMLGDNRLEHYLQDRFVTQRDGRYVLPVKESAGSNVPGIVQSHSGSGSTLFIEPQSVVPLNNELQLLKQEEKREIFRIFTQFTAEIKEEQAAFLTNQKILAELDFRFACGRLCHELNAAVPRILDEPVLNLVNARHPLLILNLGSPRAVVPFTLELGGDYRIVILSGPNTGGKTVLMKSTGLLALMALSGIPIPADPDSGIGRFASIFADIGDDQSIENALSTFSSHVQKIQRMLASAGENSLVLIDEIGAATDPQQGSALAQAILERFTELGCKAVVTTHYTALKIYAETNPACRNAAMQFDLKSLHPTYQFSTGIPGDSFAIEVASSLGMEQSLIQRARHLSGSQNVEFTDLLKKMQSEKKALARSSYEFQLKSRNLDSRLAELEGKEKKQEEEFKARRQKFLKELQQELIAQQKLYLQELEQLRSLEREERKSASERKLHEVNARLSSLRQELVDGSKQQRRQAFQPKAGDRVWLADFDAEARVVRIKDEVATVDLNGISFKTPLDNLFEAPPPNVEAEGTPLAASHVSPRAKFELKLLGLTFDEARPLIDEFIDNAVLGGLHTLRIVHGKGTGALRGKVRDYLKQKKQVLALDTPSPSEGGSGVTLVKI